MASVDDRLSELDQHIATCSSDGCYCRQFRGLYASSAGQELTALPPCTLSGVERSVDASWLWFSLVEDKETGEERVQWRCLLCDGLGTSFSDDSARWSKELRPENIRRHGKSPKHVQALQSLNLKVSTPVDTESTWLGRGPSVETFQRLLGAIQAGECQGEGGFNVDGEILGKKKSNNMIWSLGESILRRKQAKVAYASCMCLMRDERHGTLHLRFRCCDEALNVTSGYVGETSAYTPTSLGIGKATLQLLKRFCTKWEGCPDKAVRKDPEFMEDQFRHNQ